MDGKVQIGSGGITADGITWSSSRWVDRSDPEATALVDFARKTMAKPHHPTSILMSKDAYEAFRSVK